MEYLTVDEIRDEFGDDVGLLTDAQLLRPLDRLSAHLEDNLGHTFGRAATVASSGADTVQVTAAALVVGGDTYLFADYATLGALETAVAAAAGTYSMTLLPQVRPDTPSTLLKAMGPLACGPTYDLRRTLDITALWLKCSGKHESHLFLPLPLRSVTGVEENAIALASTYYWAVPGETWLIRKLCTCDTTTCRHPRGKWSAMYPGNIEVTYVPSWWNTAPGPVKAALLEAFGTQSGVGGGALESESFGEYSYRRSTARQDTWQESLGGVALRPYVVRSLP